MLVPAEDTRCLKKWTERIFPMEVEKKKPRVGRGLATLSLKVTPPRGFINRDLSLSEEPLFLSNGNNEKSRNLSMNRPMPVRKVIPKGNEAASRYTATLQPFGAL